MCTCSYCERGGAILCDPCAETYAHMQWLLTGTEDPEDPEDYLGCVACDQGPWVRVQWGPDGRFRALAADAVGTIHRVEGDAEGWGQYAVSDAVSAAVPSLGDANAVLAMIEDAGTR